MSFAALFPGQGSQHPGMGKALYDDFKISRLVFEEASDALNLDLKKLCFEGPESELRLTFNTQPALLTTSVAAWKVLEQETDKRPSVALGHSLGEYSALVAAGALSLADAIKTVRVRGLAMQEAVPVGTGGMVAVMGLSDEDVVKACDNLRDKMHNEEGLHESVLEPANFNSPGQVVVSGHSGALDYLKNNLKAEDYGVRRLRTIPLAVSAPFHCSLMKPAAARLQKQLDTVTFNKDLQFAVIHNVNAEANSRGEVVSQLLFDQMTSPVRWTQSIGKAIENGVSNFIEIGAGKVLTGLTKKINNEVSTLNVDTPDMLKETLGRLNG